MIRMVAARPCLPEQKFCGDPKNKVTLMKSAAQKIHSEIMLLGLVLAFAACETANAQINQERDLFNGKDFTGWTFFMKNNADPMQTWNVTNGVIHCAGKPAGYLRTEKRYHDYQLTVEWRFVKVARYADNTGVLVDMQLPDQVWPRCIECQGQNQKQGDFWLQGGATAKGHQGDGRKPVHVPMNGRPNEKPVGEWNTCQVIASGDMVQIIVNGKSLNKIAGCNVSAGYIGIQSEGAEIEVRKVRLKPLPAPAGK
jgi:hypothetical protein